jgi:hypothetical protein
VESGKWSRGVGYLSIRLVGYFRLYIDQMIRDMNTVIGFFFYLADISNEGSTLDFDNFLHPSALVNDQSKLFALPARGRSGGRR